MFKAYIAIYLVTNTFNITMAVFDVGQHVVNSAAGVISGSTAIDASAAVELLLETMEEMEIGELFLLALETMLISLTMKILSIIITVVLYGRMIEIYLTCSVAPIPFATMTNKELHTGLRSCDIRALRLFFETVDTKLIPTVKYPHKDTMFPVFFRLVYCCALRSCEACNLKVSDIDFSKGTICIYQAKGMKDRKLPLSDDLLDLCYRFDRYYQKQFPDRTYFFKPNQEREHMTSANVSKIFQAILKKAGLLDLPGKRFTTHGLRHLFAVQNIKKCADVGEDFYNWIQYLCKYMGHKHIRYTLYYLHITSQFFPLYREKLSALEKGIGVVYAEE